MDRIKQCLSIALTLAVNSPLLATTTNKQAEDIPWYQVDMIVFLNNTSMNTMTEAWPAPRLRPVPKEAIPLIPWDTASEVPVDDTSEASVDDMGSPPALVDTQKADTQKADTQKTDTQKADTQKAAFVALPPSSFLLNDEAERLNQSPDYQVLKQIAWRMPLLPSEQKDHPVRIATPVDDQSNYILSGTIDVSAQRYLHVDVDLWYNQLTTLPDTPEPEAVPQALLTPSTKPGSRQPTPSDMTPPLKLKVSGSFHLNESRRVTNTQQIQYLDTPVMGVLIKLTPYEKPKIKKEEPVEHEPQTPDAI